MNLLGIGELKTRKGIAYHRATIYRKIADGSFPKPIRLGEARIAFVESEIDDWLRARIAERDGKAA
jgi:prophage regulatory protein